MHGLPLSTFSYISGRRVSFCLINKKAEAHEESPLQVGEGTLDKIQIRRSKLRHGSLLEALHVPFCHGCCLSAIDYSKGNIEDGVVDSPPSRKPGRTPICSPLPLKRVSPSRGRSSSPTLQTDKATSRKLQLPLENTMEHP